MNVMPFFARWRWARGRWKQMSDYTHTYEHNSIFSFNTIHHKTLTLQLLRMGKVCSSYNMAES